MELSDAYFGHSACSLDPAAVRFNLCGVWVVLDILVSYALCEGITTVDFCAAQWQGADLVIAEVVAIHCVIGM